MKNISTQIIIKTNSSKVYDAFTKPEHLRKWWDVSKVLIEEKPGGLYTLTWQKDNKSVSYVSSGIIEKIIPSKQITIVNSVYINPSKSILGPMELAIKFKEQNGSTELTIVQSGYQNGNDWDWYYAAVKEGWPKALLNLKEYLESINNKEQLRL
ncbi:MAG: SRPBCC domain-containing protein [Melioribacteraceae bacterium]|nr:SRPBCC domain-containing protein [Melioribacteraceae bacterium]